MNILAVDRSTPFNPVAFIGEGWSIVEEDERSLLLTEIDLTKIVFKTMLKDAESSVIGEEKLKRLIVSGSICLDAKVFQTLWENQYLIPENWKKTNHFIHFEGTVLRGYCGNRCVLYLFWHDGEWHWSFSWLFGKWNSNYLSTVLDELAYRVCLLRCK